MGNVNQVVSKAGKIYDLGSWRGSGGFIADFLNAHLVPDGSHWFDYLDFYCGLMQPDETTFRPLYVYFLERLKAHACTWRYAPPALYLIDFGTQPPDDSDRESDSYDPEAAVLEDLKRTEERQASYSSSNQSPAFLSSSFRAGRLRWFSRTSWIHCFQASSSFRRI